ncbi:MAG: formyltransferase family protein [Vicinamibacterales bacterium]
MPTPRTVVLGYNFPHRKTVDILTRLYLAGVKVTRVVAADPIPLNIPAATVRTRLRPVHLAHPRDVASRLGIPYTVSPHSGDEVLRLLQEDAPQLGIVGGARILKRPVIDRFEIGIINLHPGLIPECRGLDALLWSILNGIPPGVTAHLIDERVDAGRVLLKQEVPVHDDDTLIDLGERLYETQLAVLPEAITRAVAGEWEPVAATSPANRKMPPHLEREAAGRLGEYVARFQGTSIKGS